MPITPVMHRSSCLSAIRVRNPGSTGDSARNINPGNENPRMTIPMTGPLVIGFCLTSNATVWIIGNATHATSTYTPNRLGSGRSHPINYASRSAVECDGSKITLSGLSSTPSNFNAAIATMPPMIGIGAATLAPPKLASAEAIPAPAAVPPKPRNLGLLSKFMPSA